MRQGTFLRLGRKMLEAVTLGTRILDNLPFEGLGGSRSISSDELCTKPEGLMARRRSVLVWTIIQVGAPTFL